MNNKYFSAENITLKPQSVAFYVPPIVWKGDPVGHVGESDAFFLLLEGNVMLFIDDDFYIVRAGQLAFLPKNKTRRYTCMTKEIKLYTMRFSAEASGINLMRGLGLSEHNHVVTLDNVDEVTKLFENSAYVELNKDPIYNVVWAGNILSIIKIFAFASKKHYVEDARFDSVVNYMKTHINESLTLEDLSGKVHMQPTYFCRRFHKVYGISPVAYNTTIRVYKAMELLINSDLNHENIAEILGINDVSYFSKWFKKNCGLSPSEYKNLFRKKNFVVDD